MRVALLVPNFTEYSGDARVVEAQAEELSNDGHAVSIFAFAGDIKPKSADLFIMGMPKGLFYQRIYRLLFPLDVYKAIKWLPKLKDYDMIIAHLYPMTYLCYIAKRFYDLEYVFWFHGLEDPKLFPRLYEQIYMKLQIVFTRLTIKNADKKISVSKFAQKVLNDFMGAESTVTYNKVDGLKFNPNVNGDVLKSKYNICEGPIILNVGRIVPQKGVDLLIKSFKLVKAQIPNAHLIIVGDATFKYYYERLKNISDDSIIFAGHVSPDEMPHYYALCDIYATCSLWENHNLPVLEAQLSGKPVIAFDIDAFKEEVNSNGILVEKGDIQGFAKACIDKISKMGQNKI